MSYIVFYGETVSYKWVRSKAFFSSMLEINEWLWRNSERMKPWAIAVFAPGELLVGLKETGGTLLWWHIDTAPVTWEKLEKAVPLKDLL